MKDRRVSYVCPQCHWTLDQAADDTALLRQALEALRKLYTPRQPSAQDFDCGLEAITALRERLEGKA
jgi:hypothetical protein